MNNEDALVIFFFIFLNKSGKLTLVFYSNGGIMTLAIILEIILLGIALSMDAFAVSVTDGLTYTDINKKKSFFIAGVFGVMQALMPLIGFWLVELVEVIVGETAGASAGNIMALIVCWAAFALLLFIGGKMIVEGVLSLRKPEEEKQTRLFSVKEVLFFGRFLCNSIKIILRRYKKKI